MHRFAKTPLIILVVLLGASRAPLEIGQAGRSFSKPHLDVTQGATVIFLNDDNVPHNVYTSFNGQNVDKGLSRPGEKVIITFDQSGEHHVRCAIHPKMKMTVKVE